MPVAPPALKTGEEWSGTLTFRATVDLDRLEVLVSAYEGLVVVSQPTAAAFEKVGKGEGRELAVTIRMTGPKNGSLAIFFRAFRNGKPEPGTTGITFLNSGQ